MALDLMNIEMGMKNGADAVNYNFKSIAQEINTPQIMTQSFQADNHGQWANDSGRVTKQGRIVTVQFKGDNSNSSLGTKITKLPSWAKPMEEVRSSGFEMDGNYHNWNVTNVWIDAGGNLGSQNVNPFAHTQFTITYVSAS